MLYNDISKYLEGNYNDVITKDNRFEVFYHLSETRKSLFNWYPFRNNTKLLEIGAECGALTGLFCEKCSLVTSLVDNAEELEIIKKRHKQFDNLEVKIGYNFQELHKKYDYIVIVGKLEYMAKGSKSVLSYTQKLLELLPFLADDGTMLIATENRYGLRYFCGERDPITNKPFAGLNRYLNGSTGYMFSRNELIEIMQGLPEMEYKFYYPAPDYKFPELIYTDKNLPKKNMQERVRNYSLDKTTLVMYEKRLYDDIVDNNVFPFFSNSFLIECNRKSIFADVNYVALSTDRGEEHGFITAVCENNIVKKMALYSKGVESLKVLTNNIEEIYKRGVHVVPHEFSNSMISMPFYDIPTLSEYLKDTIKNEPNKFIELFDLLYKEILKSSEEVKESECFAVNPDTEYWGPILKKAYIDMIPINCFFDGEKIIFFDQEFMKDNFPAGYIMFRALKYTYQFMPFANSIVPLESMKKKYNLVDTWDYYKKIEIDFVKENRNMDTYKEFWNWSKIDNKIIQENLRKFDK